MTKMYEKEWNAGEINQRYYEWLTGMVARYNSRYSILFRTLYETPFRVIILMDENRVGDGLSLRNRFAWEQGLSREDRDILESYRPCSVLEVMIALALRCEEEYMAKEDDEDPVGNWFEPMLWNLGLFRMNDSHYDPDIVADKLETFLSRRYSPDGLGGLFYIPGIQEDMRKIEIWQQLRMWLSHKEEMK